MIDGPRDERFPDEMSVVAAREKLAPLASTPKGHRCPVCRKQVKIYQRSLTGGSARAIKVLFLACGRDWGHLPTIVAERIPEIANQAGYLVLGQHWGLIAEQTEKGSPAGNWRVTEKGERWLRGEIAIPKYVRLYNGSRLGDPYGPPVAREDVLDAHFDRLAVLDAAPPGVDQAELFAEAA